MRACSGSRRSASRATGMASTCSKPAPICSGRRFDGFSASRTVDVRRLDGSLAERTVFGDRSNQEVAGSELAFFGQDRWRVNSRLTFEYGLRLDRDAVVKRINHSPRGGVAISIAPEGRAILRGGFGKFAQRTPLNVEAFPTFEPRTISRFAASGLAARRPDPPVQRHRRRSADARRRWSATSNGTSASAGACWSNWSS